MKPFIGRTRLMIAPVPGARRPLLCGTECLRCGEMVLVSPGDIGVVFRIGNELIGILGPCCQSAFARAEIAKQQAQRTQAVKR